MNLMQLTSFIITILMCLVSVAFITLMERKVLGYMQIRLGPNKVGTLGILQPMSDAVKLYSKEMNYPSLANLNSFSISPIISLALSLMIWISIPFFKPMLVMKFSLLMFFTILGLGIYPILISGWSSNSNYSMLGSMRALAQTISYEVSLFFILLSIMIISSSLTFLETLETQKFLPNLFAISSFSIWLISILGELNRTPFDFAEGESELVSGFNTEFSSGLFAMIFMSEYMMILFFSFFTNVIFMKGNLMTTSFFSMSMILFFLIWTRATFPRYRYDKLMNLSWKFILPISTFNLFLSIFLVIFTKSN